MEVLYETLIKIQLTFVKKKKKKRARNTASIGVISRVLASWSRRAKSQTKSNTLNVRLTYRELIVPWKAFFMLPCPSNMQLYFIPIFSKIFKIMW